MTVVILDGSSTVQRKIEELLLEINIDNMDIQPFSDGDEALEFVQNNEVDFIFSSIETEGIDGVTFVDLILRSFPKLVSRLFIVTSQKNSEQVDDIKGVGAKRFIKKPINEEYFNHFVVAEINKILHQNYS